MKGKGLPVYFVQPTQMHKECSLATLDCYGIFFSRVNDPRLLREISFPVRTTLDYTKKGGISVAETLP